MLVYPICRHCKEPLSSNAGRGLCRRCWNDIAIRTQYPPLAPFGGKLAQLLSRRRKRRCKNVGLV